jgi:hypothetical protein
MVFFIEMAFFVVALAILAVGETLGATLALGIALGLLVISFLARAWYASASAAEAEAVRSGRMLASEASSPVPDRDALEAEQFQVELLRGWRHFNLLLALGCPFLLAWVGLTR